MTINSQTRSAGPFTGTGSIVSYPFAFKVFQTSDVYVARTDTAGVQTILALGTDYTVALNGDQNTAPGGSVTPLVALPVGYSLSLTSNVPMTQNASLTNAGGFFPKTIEDALDRLVVLMQQQGFVGLGQTLRVPEVKGVPLLGTAASRANQLLGFDALGNPITTAPVNGSAAALATDLANAALAGKGAGQIGLDSSIAYGVTGIAASVGAALRGYTLVIADGVTDISAILTTANAKGKPLVIIGVAAVGTPTTITVPLVDTLSQMFATTAQVTIDNGQPVRPEWWGSGENTVHLAGLSLPTAGGVVLLRDKVYQRNNHLYNGKYWSKANVTFRGTKMPTFTNDCKALQNGTIIQGTFLAFADNLAFENLGIDCGFTYTATVNGGVASDAMFCTFNSDAAKAANALAQGLRLHNVVGLAKSPTDTVHAVIMSEGYANTVATGDIVGMFGIHGVVIKAAGVRADTIRAYCNGNEGVIIKTDAQTTAFASDIQIGKIISYAGGPEGYAPYAIPSSAAASGTNGLLFHCFAGNIFGVQIGEYINQGYEYGLNVIITPALGYVLDNVQIGRVTTRGNGTAGANLFAQNTGGALHAVQIGEMVNRDVPTGTICVWTTVSTVKIGALHAYNCTVAALAASASADPMIDTLTADNCAAAYQITNTAKPRVGKTLLKGSTAAYFTAAGSGQVPALGGTWAQIGGGDTFNVIPTHYGIELNGLISGGATNVVMTLPQFAWPATEKRFMVQGRAAGVQAAIPVWITAAGVVTINDAAGGVANVSNYLSLAGISYSITN